MAEDVRLKRIEDKIDKIVDIQYEVKVDVQKIKSDVEINTKDLTDHKEGVIQNRKRIEVLEKPSIVVAGIKNIVLYALSIVALLTALKKFNII